MNVAELRAVLMADTTGFVAGMRSAQTSAAATEAKIQAMSTRLDRIGRQLTTKVGLPLAAIGAASVKMSLDFEDSFAKMEGLAGVPRDELAGLREEVLAMGPATGKSARELAEGLYFITSSGLSGATALEALEASAKASTAGLGETEVVADAVTSAMNAYGAEALSASEATNVLVGTVRLGKAEATELAGSIGRVIPVASAMGIEFDEVGGAIAAMTRLGLDAAESTTALRAMMTGLLNPSEQAEEALMGVGTSSEALRKMIEEEGLMAGLLALNEAFDGNTASMGEVFGNVRALVGALNLLGANSEEATAIFDEMAATTTYGDEAFDAMAHTTGFRLKQAMAKLEVAAIKLGDTLVPIVANIAEGAAALGEAFSLLPGPMQNVVVAMGLMAAASGPLLRSYALIIKHSATMVTTFQFLQLRMVAMGGATGKLGMALPGLARGLAAGAIAGVALYAMLETAVRKLNEFEDAARSSSQQVIDKNIAGLSSYADATGYLGQITGETNTAIAEFNSIGRFEFWDQKKKNQLEGMASAGTASTHVMEAMVSASDQLASSFGISTDEAFAFAQAQYALNGETTTADGIMSAYRSSLAQNIGITDDAALATGEFSDEYLGAADAMQQARDALKDWEDAIRAQFDPLFGYMDAVNGLAEGQAAVADAELAIVEAQAAGDWAAAEEATRNLASARGDLLAQNIDLDIAARTLALSIAEQGGSLDDARTAIEAYGAAGRLGADDVAYLKEWLDEATWSALLLDAQSPMVSVSADTGQFTVAMTNALNLANELAATSGMQTMVGPIPSGLSPTHAGATGGLITQPTTLMAGERGRPELLLPLSDPARSSALLSSVGLGGGGGGGVVVNVNVMGRARADDGRAVVDAIKAYERSNSAGWRGGS